MTDGQAAPKDNGQATLDGADQKPWYDGADQDTVGFIQNKKWDSPLKAIEAYRGLEKHIGVPADQLLKLPKDPDSPDWGNVYNRLGRPESPDKYGEPKVKLPEGVTLDAQALSKFDPEFHKLGLSTSARNGILQKYAEYEASVIAERTKAIELEKSTQTEALKKEWGDKYEERLSLSKIASRKMFPDEGQRNAILQAMEETVGPAVIAKAFANIAEKLGEDKVHSGDADTNRFGYTKEQAINDRKTIMEEVKSDPKRLAAYNKGVGPDVEKIMKLNKMIAA